MRKHLGRNPPSRWFLVSCFVLVLTLLIASCQQKVKPPVEKITIAYTTTPNAILVNIAFAKGYFAEEGLDATPQPHPFGRLALNSVIDGKADLATVADTPVMFAVMNDRKITVIAVIQTSNQSDAIFAKKDRGIENPADLVGKKIGYTSGTTSEYFAYAFLLSHGIYEKQVRLVGMKPDDMAEAIGTGKVDAVSTWNPYLKQLQKKFGSQAVTFFGEAVYTETFCLAAGREYVKKNPEAIRKVLRALLKAETFVNKHPGESRRLASQFIQMTAADLDEIWGIFDFKIVLDQALLVDLEQQARWAIRNRLVPGTAMPNFLEFIYDNGLSSINPKAVRILR